MGFTKTYWKAIEITSSKLNNFMFKCTHRTKPEYFSRNSKMSFKSTMLIMLNAAKQSIQVEINRFFSNVLENKESVSKQAFSEARQKISPTAFVELNDAIIEEIYEKNDEYKLWNGYRVCAIDGSTVELPNNEVLKQEYGYAYNGAGSAARAKISCIYDVINKIIIKSKIDTYRTGERNMAFSMLSELIGTHSHKDLILFDRGYPSNELMAYLIDNNIKFLMRASKNRSNEVMNAKKLDQITEFKYKSKVFKIRITRFMLSSGEEEILITNLFDEQFSVQALKELYFKRWGIELKYDDLKNKLEIENFLGTTKISVEQDFYATVYLSNMLELAKSQADEELEEKFEEKNNKYDYKLNFNVLVGEMKDKFILILLEPSKRRQKKMFIEMMERAKRSLVPIRPDRHNVRKKRFSRNKYKSTQKRVL